MANVQHIYSGEGNPNSNPALALTGDAVGVHLYMNTEDGSVWISRFEIDLGVKVHAVWSEIQLVEGLP